MSQNGVRAFLNYTLNTVLNEALQSAGGAEDEGRWPDLDKWGPPFRKRERELSILFAAALKDAAGSTFPRVEVERRLRNLQTAAVALLLWPRDAKQLTTEERQQRKAQGCWTGGPLSDYLDEHSRQMMDAWREVETIAMEIEPLPDDPTAVLPEKDQTTIAAPTSIVQSIEQSGPANPRQSAEGRMLLSLRDAIDRLIQWVSSRYDKALDTEERRQLDHMGEQVAGLMLAAGISYPNLPRLIDPVMPHGPTSVPIFMSWRRNGETVLAGGVGQQWASAWRTVRIAVGARLDALDNSVTSGLTETRTKAAENDRPRKYVTPQITISEDDVIEDNAAPLALRLVGQPPIIRQVGERCAVQEAGERPRADSDLSLSLMQTTSETVLALDATGVAFTFDAGASDVKSWKRPGHPVIGGSLFAFDIIYFLRGQWYRRTRDRFDFLSPPSQVPDYARHIAREECRDWFLAAGIGIPDELADQTPAGSPVAGGEDAIIKQPKAGTALEQLGNLIKEAQRNIIRLEDDPSIRDYLSQRLGREPVPGDARMYLAARHGWIPATCAAMTDQQILMYLQMDKQVEKAPKVIEGSADDESAFRPATEFLDEQFPDFKAITKALEENPTIRWRRPRAKKTGLPIPNRLNIHAGDWKAFVAKVKRGTPDPLDLPAHVVDAAVQEVQERKAKAQRRMDEQRHRE